MDVLFFVVLCCGLFAGVSPQVRCKRESDCINMKVGDEVHGDFDENEVPATTCCFIPIDDVDVGWCAPSCESCTEHGGGCNKHLPPGYVFPPLHANKKASAAKAASGPHHASKKNPPSGAGTHAGSPSGGSAKTTPTAITTAASEERQRRAAEPDVDENVPASLRDDKGDNQRRNEKYQEKPEKSTLKTKLLDILRRIY